MVKPLTIAALLLLVGTAWSASLGIQWDYVDPVDSFKCYWHQPGKTATFAHYTTVNGSARECYFARLSSARKLYLTVTAVKEGSESFKPRPVGVNAPTVKSRANVGGTVR